MNRRALAAVRRAIEADASLGPKRREAALATLRRVRASFEGAL